MKIPFDISKRPQIESGEYKVETRDGRSVRIICWDRVAKKNTDDDLNICVLVPEDNGEAVYYYHQSGKKWVEDERYDLFLITPGPELSEFEKKVSEIGFYDVDIDGITHIKEAAAELLDLARKEIEEELKEKVLHDYWKQASDQCAQERKEAKAEALKDLPRWRRWGNGACGNGQGIPIAIVKRELGGYTLVDSLGIPGEQYIMLSDLEKLPGLED